MSETRAALSSGFLDRLDERLATTDDLLAGSFPGEDGRRQPVHTVYVPADQYTSELPVAWGRRASGIVEQHGGIERVCDLIGLSEELTAEVAPRVSAKLASDPIEDLRLDFEDGYGDRGDDVEDRDAVAAGRRLAEAFALGVAPSYAGLRFKCFEAPTRRRGVRTLDLFLGGLLAEDGGVPEGLTITFAKVSTVDQVEAMVSVCEELEAAHGLPEGRLGFEIQVETPQLIIGPTGRVSVAEAVHAAQGRATALHYGTYDYSASLQIAAEFQASDHPAADFAKQVMQVSVAGTAVHLSDGSTNILPVGTPEQVEAAWRVHSGLVTRALERGFYQGWDLHPHQLPTRFAATFAFFRAGMPRAATRLANYVGSIADGILDEPATARALARYLQRGLACGAVDAEELTARTGLEPAALAALARPRP